MFSNSELKLKPNQHFELSSNFGINISKKFKFPNFTNKDQMTGQFP